MSSEQEQARHTLNMLIEEIDISINEYTQSGNTRMIKFCEDRKLEILGAIEGKVINNV